jgi:hypothetical protein
MQNQEFTQASMEKFIAEHDLPPVLEETLRSWRATKMHEFVLKVLRENNEQLNLRMAKICQEIQSLPMNWSSRKKFFHRLNKYYVLVAILKRRNPNVFIVPNPAVEAASKFCGPS